ncbi:MAG: hypothetical protein LBS40_08320 [Burkholderiales bacterium]|nr:hypothetical protein [Burkholderiales bacterium]
MIGQYNPPKVKVSGIATGNSIDTSFYAAADPDHKGKSVVHVIGHRDVGLSGTGKYTVLSTNAGTGTYPRASQVGGDSYGGASQGNFFANKSKVIRIHAARYTAAALTETGDLYAWGYGEYNGSILGCDDNNVASDAVVFIMNEEGELVEDEERDPTAVRDADEEKGDPAIDANKTAERPCQVLGTNYRDKDGNPDERFNFAVENFDGGEHWFIAITKAKEEGGRKHVFTWGHNNAGQLGIGNLSSSNEGTNKTHEIDGTTPRPEKDKNAGYPSRPLDITSKFGEKEYPQIIGGGYETAYAVTRNIDSGEYTLWSWGDKEGCATLFAGENEETFDKKRNANCPAGVHPLKTPAKVSQKVMPSALVEKIQYIHSGQAWGAAHLKDTEYVYEEKDVVSEEVEKKTGYRGRVIGWGRLASIGQGYTYTAAGGAVPFPIEIRIPATATEPTKDIELLICRYVGCVAVKGVNVYSWGQAGSSAFGGLYAPWPTPRPTRGIVSAIGVSKESVLYSNTAGDLYHVGYNGAGGLRSNICAPMVRSYNYDTERWEHKGSMNWPGRKLPASFESPWMVLDPKFCNGSTKIRGIARDEYRKWSNFDTPDPDEGPYPSHVTNWHAACVYTDGATRRWSMPTDDAWKSKAAPCNDNGDAATHNGTPTATSFKKSDDAKNLRPSEATSVSW